MSTIIPAVAEWEPQTLAGLVGRRHVGRVPGLAVALVLLLAPTAGAVEIDAFTSATPQTAQPNSEVAAAVLGGYRDVKSNNAGNEASADGGRFRCSGTAAYQGCTVQYDGQDLDPVTFTPGGFAATDFTAGGHDRIVIPTYVTAGACNLYVEVCDNDAPTPQCGSRAVSNVPDGGRITFLFADFDAGLDFTAITAIQVNLTPTAAPVDCSIGALRTSPLFEDGFEAGDTLAWSTTFP